MQNPALMKLAAMGKPAIIIIGCLSLIISGVFCGMYWDLWADAQEFNTTMEDAGYKGDIPAYDTCGSAKEDYTTMWTTLFALNSCCYLILSLATLFIMLGALWAPIAALGVCIHCCGGCLHFATIICTGVWRYSSEGTACADLPGNEVGDKIQSLFIAQCILYCVYGCCTGCLIQVGMITGMMSAVPGLKGKMGAME